MNEEATVYRRGEHCWHAYGAVYASYPAQHDEKCCWCGTVRRVRGVVWILDGHGPHVLAQSICQVEEEVGPCSRTVQVKSDALLLARWNDGDC